MDKKDTGNDVELDDIELEDITEEDSTSTKIKNLRKDLSEAKKEKTDILTELQKAKADFINMRKRDEESNKEFIKYAKEGVISDIVPVLDSFDMAMGNKEAWEKAPSEWRVGVEYIYNQLVSILEQNGLSSVDPIGLEFSPQLHEALEMVPTENKDEDGKIMAVIQKGYQMGGKTIRPAKVKVGEIQQK
jgi:molecular chaperone GrpE